MLASYPSSQPILPAPVIAETGWIIAAVLGPATHAAFIASVAAGDFTVTDLPRTTGNASPSWSSVTPT
ncbi:MAG: hypothetical protein AAB131_06525 [Actinomycetota bacterium]|jgi:hypothetical protein|nr:MAG: hypothetical protein FD127_3131 [Acidimicrobiaceae bacterium]